MWRCGGVEVRECGDEVRECGGEGVEMIESRVHRATGHACERACNFL